MGEAATSLAGARTTRFVLSTQRGASGGARSFNSVLARAKPSTRDVRHEQRHIEASASTVKESGAQGTIRLLRAWVKPLPAWPGRAHLVLCSQPSVAQAVAHSRSIRCWRARNPVHATCDHEQRHSGASASTVKESGAQGTIRLLRAWVKPSQLGRGARTSFCALNPAWRKRWRTLEFRCWRARNPVHATCDTSSATSKPAPAR